MSPAQEGSNTHLMIVRFHRRGGRSKESFKQQMQLVLKESSQMDREDLMEYLDGKAFQNGNTRRVWLKCLWAFREMKA